MLTVTVAKWGNSIGIRLPKEVALSGQISIGDNLHIEATEDIITLKKVKTIKKYPPQSSLPKSRMCRYRHFTLTPTMSGI